MFHFGLHKVIIWIQLIIYRVNWKKNTQIRKPLNLQQLKEYTHYEWKRIPADVHSNQVTGYRKRLDKIIVQKEYTIYY